MKRKPSNFPSNFNYDRSISDRRARRVRLKPAGLKSLMQLRAKMRLCGWVK